MSDWMGVVWLVVLLGFNAFFVGAEFAVISARRAQIEPRANKGSKAAKMALQAMESASLMLAMCQLGITVCSLLILYISEPSIHHLLEVPLYALGLPPEVITVAGYVITLVLVTYLHVVFGEMVPKNASFSMPTRFVLLLAPPLLWISRIFKPIIGLLNGITNGMLRLMRIEPKDEANSAFTLDQVETIVEESKREGLLFDPTGALAKTFEFTSRKVADVSLPLADIVTLPLDATTEDVEAAVRERGFSRYVFVDGEGEPVGYLHIKDVLGTKDEASGLPVQGKRIRRLASLFEQSELEDAMQLMRSSGAHVAKTFNAEGETTGLLFLEDILEELVGEVRDATRRLR
ncbi:MAG TPA: hemolysin family protein [Candidatus Agrococcus pullicola]|uniref:Hemolysin family protein n=1 Tax=Candidatus Agrococcus pullicola TaxID=2838429 RepID=A0A9D1YTZ9_9MICO|nr:hemolysin family protein [Candidatus Agrococcus pullicola]